jgi:uncharacterized membrane protein YdjX (TVP38/TMEM64 family)
MNRVTQTRLPARALVGESANETSSDAIDPWPPVGDDESSAPRALSVRRLLPLLLLAAAGILFLALGGRHYLTFAALAENSEWLRGWVARSNGVAALCFIAVYAGLTALSVPGAAILTITSGFLFGLWHGLVYAVIGATIGATAIFLVARAGLGHLAERAGPLANRLKEGFGADALNYLLVLRLIPLFPFWLVNIVAALAGMRLGTYVIGTLVGIIPGTFVYVSLGNGMGDIVAMSQAPDLSILFRSSALLPIIGLAVLALMPVLYKRWRARRDGKSA